MQISVPQGLKPAWFMALTARAKPVPFHITIYQKLFSECEGFVRDSCGARAVPSSLSPQN